VFSNAHDALLEIAKLLLKANKREKSKPQLPPSISSEKPRNKGIVTPSFLSHLGTLKSESSYNTSLNTTSSAPQNLSTPSPSCYHMTWRPYFGELG
jgi:hypothetical protein